MSTASRRYPLRSVASAAGSALLVLAIGWIVFQVLAWAVLDAVAPTSPAAACAQASGACWPFLNAKLRLILFGRYPYEEQWRAGCFLVVAAIVIGWTLWWGLRMRRGQRGGGKSILMAWAVGGVAATSLLLGGVFHLPPVSLESIDGLPLTILLALGGSLGAFWLSIPLAMARRSSMPVLSWLATTYIEFVRGIPLVAFLFMAFVLSPLLLPPGWNFSSPVRALLVLIFFLAAYMAEVVRGAMQNIPAGQYEAAATVGLGYWKTMRLVVLPQALQQAMPSLANMFIGAIKDTSIVLTVGLFDLLGAAESAVSDPAWGGRFLEIYVFVALIFLLLCGGVSFYSRLLERVSDTPAGKT